MTEEISVEEKARSQGWVPQDEYNGPEENWKSAEEFVEVGERISAITKERNDKLLSEISALKKDMHEWNAIREREIAAVREASYNKAIKELQEKQMEAVEEGDIDKFKSIQQEIAAVQKPEPIKQPQQTKQETPKEFVDWASKNSWYGNDAEMTRFADAIGQTMSAEFSDPAKFYSAVGNAVKRAYPDKFKDQTPSKIPDVESPNGSSGTKSKSKHKFNDLPPDAQAACDKYIKRGWYKTREDYMKVFYGEE